MVGTAVTDVGTVGEVGVVDTVVFTDRDDAAAIARTVIAMTDVLGINPLDPAWSAGDS